PHVSHPLRWGILGTGAIAHSFAKALLNSNTGELVAVGSRTAATAERFADEFGVANRHASYQSLMADPEVDAIYIALPNHLHLEWVIRCAEAGKHILCEKPLASNYAEAMVAVEAAHYHDVFLMEAFMYRCHPQTARLAELVRQHVIGDVRLIEARFSFNVGQPRYDQFRHQSASAGGGIMDVGCYCTSAARLIAGASTGKDVAEPLEVKGCAYLDPIGRIDEWASAVCRFPGDIIANLTCGMMVSVDSMVAVWGSDGHILVPNPWFPGEKSEILLFQQKEKEPQKIEVITGSPLYTIEADTVARSLERRQASAPCMTWDDSLGNMKTLDCWRKDVGLVFDNERPEALRKPFTICPVARRPLPKMTYGRVDGVTKPISRLVMGTMVLHQANMPFACALLDHYVELGGNCLDTAYVYNTEGIVGRWLKLRDNRDSIVLITKGAHTPYCYPEALTRELLISLERFQTDYTDLYFMHRDNLDVPVGEFVECLNEHKRAGRIHAFGGSNWTIERIQAANDYAHAHGLVGFTASSPNFSLGVWNEPMWAGCVSAVDPASRSWYQHSQMPLFAWSSQASGFFTGRYKCDDRSNPALADLVRTWFNEANFRRLERAQQLAADKGVTSAEVALAYVLSQPLNIFALIGPRTLGETRISAQALELTLTAEEMRWLNLEI
ncbi:MAG: aldo/keto reductase, partial [Anaerolineae bacterium]